MSSKTVTSILFGLLFVVQTSAASQDMDLARAAQSLIGKSVPFNGPNCINAALLGAGLVPTVIEILPHQAEQLLMSQCFQETTAANGIIGAILEKGSVAHLFYKIPNSTYAFTKNGSSSTAPFSVSTVDSVLKLYMHSNARFVSYVYKPQPSCPIEPFNLLLKSDRNFGQVAAELLERTRSGNWDGDYPIDLLDRLYDKVDALNKAKAPSWGLVRLMVSTCGSSPLFKKALKERSRQAAITYFAKELALPREAIAKKSDAIAEAEKQLSILISKSPLANTSIDRLAKRKMLRLDFAPLDSSPQDRRNKNRISMQVKCAPEVLERKDCSEVLIRDDLKRTDHFSVNLNNYTLRKTKDGETLELKLDATTFILKFGTILIW